MTSCLCGSAVEAMNFIAASLPPGLFLITASAPGEMRPWSQMNLICPFESLSRSEARVDQMMRHRGVTAQQHLLARRAAAPVGDDVRLERGDLVVRALEVERIELVGRDAVGEQRRLPHAGAPFVERALARIFRNVEEIGHALRRIGAEFLRVIGDHVGEEVGRGGVVPAEALCASWTCRRSYSRSARSCPACPA